MDQVKVPRELLLQALKFVYDLESPTALADALRAALDASAVEPVGWRLVPIEPTPEMTKAFAKTFNVYDQKATFPEAVKAMIAAAPQAQQPAPRKHITDGSTCWCNPETVYTDPDTGASVIVHKEPQ